MRLSIPIDYWEKPKAKNWTDRNIYFIYIKSAFQVPLLFGYSEGREIFSFELLWKEMGVSNDGIWKWIRR